MRVDRRFARTVHRGPEGVHQFPGFLTNAAERAADLYAQPRFFQGLSRRAGLQFLIVLARVPAVMLFRCDSCDPCSYSRHNASQSFTHKHPLCTLSDCTVRRRPYTDGVVYHSLGLPSLGYPRRARGGLPGSKRFRRGLPAPLAQGSREKTRQPSATAAATSAFVAISSQLLSPRVLDG